MTPMIENGIAWYDVRHWGVEGRGWDDTLRYFDRLPARAAGLVRPDVWELGRHSAGMMARFATNATAVHVRYALLSAALSMPHMPATGVSGLDLYARDHDGLDRWLAVTRPEARRVAAVIGDLDPPPQGQRRTYAAYLPLYNGVASLQFGVAEGADFEPLAPRVERPLVFYGTSIMQGACASRPGMSITAILGRRLGRPVINLGFSGNGRMEAEVGSLLAELSAAVYVIDCLPNMQADQVAERTVPLVRQLREARPDTPILLVEDRTKTNARFQKPSRDQNDASRSALRGAFDRLTREGVGLLHYLEGRHLLGDDGEAATDGSHPNDVGMVRYADAYEPSLRQIPGTSAAGVAAL